MPVAGDVPGIFDVVINGEGYLVSDIEDVKAVMGSAPIFSPRESDGNTDAEWFATFELSDWSRGENQRSYMSEQGSKSQYWRGSGIDVTYRGEAILRQSAASSVAAAAPQAMCARGAQTNTSVAYVTTSNLYEIDASGTITDRGAHGAGAPVAGTGICTDGGDLYIAGATSIRKWNGAAFSTFASVAVSSIAYFDDFIFATRSSNGDLLRFDRATGEVTQIKAWLQGDGTAQVFGAGILYASPDGLYMIVNKWEPNSTVWVYDGNPQFTVSKVMQLPTNFQATNLCVCNHNVYVSGYFSRYVTSELRAAVYVSSHTFSATSTRIIWEEDAWATAANNGASAPIATWEGGVLIASNQRSTLIYYDPDTEGYHTVAALSAVGLGPLLTASNTTVLYGATASTTLTRYPSTTMVSSGTIDTSLIDMGSPLNKRFNSIEIEATIPTGASIDISYQLESVEGNYTSLQVGAANKTTYSIAQNGRSISFRITLNKGTTATPILRKIIVRSLPYQAIQRYEVFYLNLSGRDGTRPLTLRNGSLHAKDGLQMAIDLRTAAALNSGIAVTDEFGTFSGYIDTARMEFRRVRNQEYIAVVPIREVV